MCQIQLTKQEIDNLRKIQRKTKDKRIYRKVSVILGLMEGFTIEQLSTILGIDESTVKRYKKKYTEFGLEKLLQDDFKPYWGKLTSKQMGLLVKELKDNMYTTTTQISDWIEKQFGKNIIGKDYYIY